MIGWLFFSVFFSILDHSAQFMYAPISPSILPKKISLKRKAYEEAGVPADKAPGFAAQTVKENPAEQLPTLTYPSNNQEGLKTEPRLADSGDQGFYPWVCLCLYAIFFFY